MKPGTERLLQVVAIVVCLWVVLNIYERTVGIILTQRNEIHQLQQQLAGRPPVAGKALGEVHQ